MVRVVGEMMKFHFWGNFGLFSGDMLGSGECSRSFEEKIVTMVFRKFTVVSLVSGVHCFWRR